MNKIRILFLIDQLTGGGAEKALCKLVNHLDPNLFDITVLTRYCCAPETSLAPHIRYRAMNPGNRGLFDLWLRLCFWLGWGYSLLVGAGFDVEVAFLECFPTKVLAASQNKHALKLAWVHCDLGQKTLPPDYFDCYRAFDRVVCVSRAVQESLARLMGRKGDILPNVWDSQEILEKSRAYLPETTENFTFAAVGRLSEEKGFHRLIAAARRLRGEGYSFTLLLMGDGPERARLEAAAEGTVRFLGFQENPYPYMAAADALVIPSRTEGCSTVAAEGLILGKAMAATNCSGMEDLLGDCALLVENSAQGVYQGMKQLLTDPALGYRLAAAAKDRGRGFSKEETVKQTQEYLLWALAEKRGRPWQFI